MGKWTLLLLVAGCSSASVGAVAQGDAGADVARPVDAGHDVAAGDDAGEDATPEIDAADEDAIADAAVDTAPPPECTEGAKQCGFSGHSVERCVGGTWTTIQACGPAPALCRCSTNDCVCQ